MLIYSLGDFSFIVSWIFVLVVVFVLRLFCVYRYKRLSSTRQFLKYFQVFTLGESNGLKIKIQRHNTCNI